MRTPIRNNVGTALLVIGLMTSMASGAEPRRDSVLAQRLDQTLQVLCRAQQLTGPATEPDRISAYRLSHLAQAQHGRGGGLLSLLVQHTAGLDQLRAAGFTPQATIGQVTSGTLAADRLAELAQLSGVQFVQLSRPLTAFSSPHAAPPAGSRNQGRDRAKAATESADGAGVLIGFIDTGADIFHHDFRHADGSTRISSLLDFSNPGDVDGDGILDGDGPFGGTLYTETQINDALASGQFTHHDTTGHGSHGLSIAAGDNATLPGLAPAADLIVVAAAREPGSLGFTSSDLINALAFIDDKAAELGQPYVANLSLGTMFSSHDGRSLEELAIDALVGPGKPGKAVVAAAGNSSDNRSSRYHHLGGTAYVGVSSSHTLTVDPYTPNPDRGDDRFVLDLWWQGNDRLAVTVTGPDACGAPEVTAPYGTFRDSSTPCGDVFIANMGGANPLNGDTEAIILVDDWSGTAPASGSWTLTLTGEQIGASGEYHGWLAEQSQLGDTSPFLSNNADNHYLVGKPGGAYNAITVGSHAADLAATRFATSWTNVNGEPRVDSSAIDGDISDFSSSGPTRDRRIKPELTAPGERVRGAVSRDAYPGVSADSIYRYHPWPEADALIVDDAANNAFGMLQGTSFSAPVVTGLVARILATDPSLDAIQIRNMLVNTAVADSFTGAVPNPIWGHGKADLSIGTTTLPGDLHITAEQLPDGGVGRQYNNVLTASGGTLPYTWWLEAGTVPPSLSLDATGFLSGVPTTPGSFVFTAGVSDGSLPPQQHTQVFELEIVDPAPLDITGTTAPLALIGESYDSSVQAGGGTPPYTFTLAGGSLPDGLFMLGNGTISGEATTLGSFYFTIQAEDSATATALRSMRIRVGSRSGDAWRQLGQGKPATVGIVTDPTNSSRRFCSVSGVGVFSSSNGGDSWEIISINNGFPAESHALDLAVNPVTGELLATVDSMLLHWDEAPREWVTVPPPAGLDGFRTRLRFDSTGKLFAFGKLGDSSQLLASPDNGGSWQVLSDFVYSSLDSNHDVSVFEAAPETMYMAASNLIAITTDSGDHWFSVTNGTTGPQDSLAVSQSDRFDVVVCNQDLWRTADGGRNWSMLYDSLGCSGLVRSTSDPEHLLMVDRWGGAYLYRSTNGGTSWEGLTDWLPEDTLFDVEMVDDDPSHLVIGTEEGPYLSQDGGASWQLMNDGLQILDLVAVEISANNSQTLVLLSTSGPLVSLNHGDSWTLSSTGLSQLYSPRILELSPVTDHLVYAIMYSRLYRSDNRGVTWAETSPDFSHRYYFATVAADPFDSEVVVAGTQGSRGVYRSSDRGATWTDAFAGLPYEEPTDLAFAADVEGRLYLSFDLEGIYRSEDRGETWSEHGLNTQTVQIVRPAPSDSEYVYALSEDAIWFLDPAAGTWQQATTSPVNPVLCMAVDPSNRLVAYAGADNPGAYTDTGGLYTTVDGGMTWIRIPGLLDQFDVVSVAIDPSDPATLFAATRHGGIYRSPDSGASWTNISSYGTVASHINVTVQDPTNPFLLLAGTEGYGVQVSADAGRSFEPRVSGLGNLEIAAIAFDPDDPTTVYVGSAAGIFVSDDSAASWSPTALSAGEVTDMVTDNEGSGQRIWATVRGEGVAFSADGGATFSVSATGLLSLELTGIAVEHLGSGQRIWATMLGGDGVACSTDDGRTWLSAAGNGLVDRNVSDIAVDVLGQRIWATTASGVLYTEDAGLSWHPLNHGLPSGVPVSSVSIDPLSGEAFVSLDDAGLGGVFRGGNTVGVWSEFNAGLEQLLVGRLTNDGGQVDGGSARTTFYASTRGAGVWAATVDHPTLSPPVITTVSLPATMATRPYTATLAAADGAPPYRWSLVGGALPPGLVLNGETGVISGAAALPGITVFTVQVADGSRQTGTAELGITVQPFIGDLFADGFESGDTSAWSSVVSP